MAGRNVFDTEHVKEKALVETSGLLDQLNLPPALVSFLRRNQRTIWIVVACVAAVVTAVSLYNSYRAYQLNKAATALDKAMELSGEERKAALSEVSTEFASTPSGLWARISLAHLARDEGDIDQAAGILAEVNGRVKDRNPLKPLLLAELGHLYEQKQDLDRAAATFEALQAWDGFLPEALVSLGRVYEKQDKKDRAIEMYKKYLDQTREGQGPLPGDDTRDLVQARLNRLQQ